MNLRRLTLSRPTYLTGPCLEVAENVMRTLPSAATSKSIVKGCQLSPAAAVENVWCRVAAPLTSASAETGPGNP